MPRSVLVAPMTKSSIDDALTEFLREQQTRVAPRTFARYEEVIDLFKHSMNGYGYQGLDEAEHARWQEVFDAGDEDAFTRVFGPEKIPENLGEFLGYFMVHKVMAGGDLLRASGTNAHAPQQRRSHGPDHRPSTPCRRARSTAGFLPPVRAVPAFGTDTPAFARRFTTVIPQTYIFVPCETERRAGYWGFTARWRLGGGTR